MLSLISFTPFTYSPCRFLSFLSGAVGYKGWLECSLPHHTAALFSHTIALYMRPSALRVVSFHITHCFFSYYVRLLSACKLAMRVYRVGCKCRSVEWSFFPFCINLWKWHPAVRAVDHVLGFLKAGKRRPTAALLWRRGAILTRKATFWVNGCIAGIVKCKKKSL